MALADKIYIITDGFACLYYLIVLKTFIGQWSNDAINEALIAVFKEQAKVFYKGSKQ